MNMVNIEHYWSGASQIGQSVRRQSVCNPATGAVTGQVVLGSVQDVAQAVAAAQVAWPAWAEAPALKRARVMFKFLELLNQRRDELAHLITAEHGKVFTDAQG